MRVRVSKVKDGNKEFTVLLKKLYICMMIQDERIGIPDAYISKIFDPYFTTKEEGHGLGFPTSYSIIKKYEGKITVESEFGKGTVFKIYIPALDTQTEQSDLDEDQEHDQDQDFSNGRGKVLVMDDENGIREIVSAMLSRIGYSVKTVTNGSEAVEEYQQAMEDSNGYDAVILDLNIPGRNGGHKTLQGLFKIDPRCKGHSIQRIFE